MTDKRGDLQAAQLAASAMESVRDDFWHLQTCEDTDCARCAEQRAKLDRIDAWERSHGRYR